MVCPVDKLKEGLKDGYYYQGVGNSTDTKSLLGVCRDACSLLAWPQ